MLKYEHIPVGTKIRAYDFEPMGDFRDGLYVEGTVIRHDTKEGAKFLVINTEADTVPLIRETRPSRVGHETYVPMETAFFEWDGRVVKISTKIFNNEGEHHDGYVLKPNQKSTKINKFLS